MPSPDLPIRTDRLVLRAFRADDLDAMNDLYRRPDVVRFLPWGAQTLEESQRMLDRVSAMTAIDDVSADALRLAMTLPGDDTLIGDVSLWRTSREHNEGEIGFVVHPDRHGNGYAIEAMRALVAIGFRGARLHRIVGRCDARNVPSARLMERLGMRREAHFRANEWLKGEWTDELVYAILAEEWPDRP